jgi:hypothetical protein
LTKYSNILRKMVKNSINIFKYCVKSYNFDKILQYFTENG